ncbi:MAG TPA: hypothetical protein VNO70_13770, partial [Blastocatellia bacterium]|nr:hypothetical protein [Blastocatellia bacterium]
LEGDFRFEIGDFKNPLAKTQRRKARKEPPEQEGSHKTAIRYRLSAEQWQQVAGKLWEMEIAIEQLLRQLPIGAARAAIFSERLKANLSSKLGSKLPIFKHACNHATKLTFTKRRQLAVALGKSVASKYREAKPSSLAALLQPSFVFASVLPVAFFAPHHVMTAGSYRECMSAGCNLMFLGSVFATLAAIPGEGRKKKRECCCECECCGDCCEGGCHCCCNCSDCNCCGDCNCCDCNCCD